MLACPEVSSSGYPTCPQRSRETSVADRRFRPCRKGPQPKCLATPSAARRASTQHQLAVARQLPFHLFVHLLVGNAGAPHFILVLYQNFAHFVVQAVFDGQLFHHALPHALRHRLRRLTLNLVPFDEPLDDFRGHMAHIIPNEQHSKRVLYPIALIRYKEKQFTGCPHKVQLSVAVASKQIFAADELRQEERSEDRDQQRDNHATDARLGEIAFGIVFAIGLPIVDGLKIGRLPQRIYGRDGASVEPNLAEDRIAQSDEEPKRDHNAGHVRAWVRVYPNSSAKLAL